MDYSNLSKQQKWELVQKMRIIHPAFKSAIKMIEMCHKRSKKSLEPMSAVITGESGTGKTTIIKHYVEQYDKVDVGDYKTTRRILSASIPSPASKAFLAEALLKQMGDAYYYTGTVANKIARLSQYITKNGIELIILDEFQHFINAKNKRINYDTADWFKSIINAAGIPVIFFGLPDCKQVLVENEQLSRRVKNRLDLSQFGYSTQKERQAFQRLLHEIERNLPFEESSGFTDEEMCLRIFDASKGLMDTIMNLVREAAYLAIEDGAPKIELEHLATAFSMNGHVNKAVNNPFIYEEYAR
ncbi:ATP-binding protein [Bacillus sp. EB01]|uniref:ATP-binding protein n=1 Tax=Bacillus sp. EB01 TaxID=1347086 RepID=UPI0005C5AEE3|nr:ATP-binding protein [Bacillus sp. EB01]